MGIPSAERPNFGVNPMPSSDPEQFEDIGFGQMPLLEGTTDTFIAPAPVPEVRRDMAKLLFHRISAEILTSDDVFAETGNPQLVAHYREVSPRAQSMFSQFLRVQAMRRAEETKPSVQPLRTVRHRLE